MDTEKIFTACFDSVQWHRVRGFHCSSTLVETMRFQRKTLVATHFSSVVEV